MSELLPLPNKPVTSPRSELIDALGYLFALTFLEETGEADDGIRPRETSIENFSIVSASNPTFRK